jgi:hypothetical protein
MSLRTCLLLALAGTMLGLLIRLALPVGPPEPALLARIEWWEQNAEALARGHHIERADDMPCGTTFCAPGPRVRR